MVKASGANLPAGRTVVTGTNGTFKFEYLLPGEYDVAIESDPGRAMRHAVVDVGKDTQVDFVAGLAVRRLVSVTGIRPVVTSNPRRSASTSRRMHSGSCRSSAPTAACSS